MTPLLLARRPLLLAVLGSCPELSRWAPGRGEEPAAYLVTPGTRLRLLCVSERGHAWAGSGPAWTAGPEGRRVARGGRELREAAEAAGAWPLPAGARASLWRLPPFTARHVGRYSCTTKPGLEAASVLLYSSSSARLAVARGPGGALAARVGVPATLPCLPAHPAVRVALERQNHSAPPPGFHFLPGAGFRLDSPKEAHSGLYRCVFRPPACPPGPPPCPPAGPPDILYFTLGVSAPDRHTVQRWPGINFRRNSVPPPGPSTGLLALLMCQIRRIQLS
jgi:hypothetical protein